MSKNNSGIKGLKQQLYVPQKGAKTAKLITVNHEEHEDKELKGQRIK
ncbi:MAG: hypothetical protein SCALA701_30790 [Candidatus Scalindua sp.]|nr:hypothetical protein [Planctomycetota bacterium]GJQ60278.1 MAG: hypothetical protein SCALA701_30790 [Candidatus Scalindua sp.]